MDKNVLIINDKPETMSELKSRLEERDAVVFCVASIEAASRLLSQKSFNLVILDAELSAEGGHQLLSAMKRLASIPVLALSSQTDHAERLTALNAGAHAYLGRPYTMEECLAQAQSLMQLHINSNPSNCIYFTLVFARGLTIDTVRRQVFLKNKEVSLTKTEFDLLLFLASDPGRVFSRAQIYEMVWKEPAAHNIDDVVKTHIKTLRQKLSKANIECIKNVWGVGYRFLDDVSDKGTGNPL